VNEALTLPGGGIWKVGPGQVTDDSEMALCLLRGLESAAPPALPEEAIAAAYADWYNTRPFDIGVHARGDQQILWCHCACSPRRSDVALKEPIADMPPAVLEMDPAIANSTSFSS